MHFALIARRGVQRLALILVAVLLAVAAPRPALAQDLFTAIVKVNDVVISGYDLQQRMRLLRLAAPNSDENVLRRQAVEQLIADELKLQEAERTGVSLAAGRLDDAIGMVARRNNQTLEEFNAEIAAAGVDRESFERQLRADMLWNELLRRRFGERVTPTEEEIDAAVAQSTGGGEVRYDLQQIVVPLRPDASQDRVRRAFEEAQRVRRELNDCGKVRELAPRYAQISGPVGRLTVAQMPPPIATAVQPLAVGQTTNPMRSQDGVHIIILCDRLTPEAANRSQVYNQLLAEKAGRFSESYLDDLRRGAMIERRL